MTDQDFPPSQEVRERRYPLHRDLHDELNDKVKQDQSRDGSRAFSASDYEDTIDVNDARSEMSSPCQACLHEQKAKREEPERYVDNIGGATVSNRYTTGTIGTTPRTTRHSARVSFCEV